MAIVDNQHAALAMTGKGKTFKFDAIECLIPFLETQPETEFKVITVNDYLSPGDMIPAEESTFLISQSIPSPMGAFLSAFPARDQALTAQRTGGGKIYTWDELLIHFKQ
jgi:copper chaperone NosL